MSPSVDVAPRPLSGWGRTTPTTALVSRPADAASVERALRTHTTGVIARGLGRSYGDAAQCSGGLTLDVTGLDWIGAVDEGSGTVEVGAGVSLHDLMRTIIPAGWFVGVTPGTRYVSVGGAIAADVHGKNHHRDGSFARHVVEMTLVTPTGTVRLAPDDPAGLFWATAGGMGLTGVVVERDLAAVPDRDLLDARGHRALLPARRPHVHDGSVGPSISSQRRLARLRRPAGRRIPVRADTRRPCPHGGAPRTVAHAVPGDSGRPEGAGTPLPRHEVSSTGFPSAR